MFCMHHYCSQKRGRLYVQRRTRIGSLLQCSSAFIVGILLVCASVSGGRANGIETLCVEAVETRIIDEQLEVRVNTTAPSLPSFSAFPLREPDRLVMDFPDYLWGPGYTGHLESDHPQIREVRVGQFSEEPPITRIVFDLRVPAEQVKYKALSAAAHGQLRIQVSPAEASGASETPPPAVPGRKPDKPAAPPAVKPTAKPPKPRPTAGQSKPPKDIPSPSGPASPPATSGTGEGAAVEPGAAAPGAGPITGTAGDRPTEPGAAAGTQTVEPPTPRPADVGVAAAGPSAGEPPAPTKAGMSWKGYLLRALAALVVIAGIGALAFWLRNRFRGIGSRAFSLRNRGRTSESTEPTASLGAIASAGPEGTIRCRIIDGYLVLAPETVTGMQSMARQEARVEGSVEVIPAQQAAQVEVEEQPQAADAATRAEELVRSLAGDSGEARKEATRGLMELATSGRAEVLLPYLKSEDTRVRTVLAGVLGEAGAADCAGALADIAEDSDPSVRAAALYALAQLGPAASEHVAAVRERLSDEESSVRARATRALAALAPEDEEAARQVIELADDTDPAVRQAAASASFVFARNGVTQPLLGLLADISRRAQALELLQQADEAIIRQLLVNANKASSETSDAAVGTLAYVISARFAPSDFRDDLQSSDADVRMAGLHGLAIVGGDEMRQDVLELSKNDPSPEVRARAAEVLTYWDELAEAAAPAGGESGHAAS